ncbi:hypothetical protein BO85DRAFT_200399 [Aspergillus piperis CBS 112811]|uniref:Uncharacterized protein n=1 Tax=Aspergillus piperis CBS 112811 TaxID=1448313 RepID=A0A8G1QTP1_9EURO|nr:hypothetical protein BO85DRAFT_200399 [Aspergillus piperis CBS 112811]RAH52632.1 hypothetical protein BO85DRAFT_200399 [Aspergillus piperis CBS 112811]
MGRSALSLEVAGVRARSGLFPRAVVSSRILGPEKVKKGRRKQLGRSKQVPAAREEEISRKRSDQISSRREGRQSWRNEVRQRGESDFEGVREGPERQAVVRVKRTGISGGGRATRDERERKREREVEGKDNHHFQDKAIQGCT